MKTTNLLQSYIRTNPALAQYNADKARENFDVKKELANRTFIKPLPSNSQFVKNTIFDVPSEVFRDIKYDMKAFKHAVQGRANDHELGCMNDLGMKIGGLAIATYLFANKKTPLTKIMEFIGLVTFFGAMDIWPKLALQLPAKLVHGFDIRQEYRDNSGTKKPVFQDHQFIPWDLYSDEEINKIGDRMGVPKEMKNRRDFIQEKMRKIALQNNTMWMLTAGFATPILSALLCNALEKPINKYQDQSINESAEQFIKDIEKVWSKYEDESYIEDITTLLRGNKDKPITPNLLKQITEAISVGIDPVTALGIEKDLNEILINDGFDFSKDSLNRIREIIKKGFNPLELPEKELEEIIPSAQELYNTFFQKDLVNPDSAKEGVTDFTEHIKAILNIMDKKISAYTQKVNNSDLADDLYAALDSILYGKKGQAPEIYKIFSDIPTSKLTEAQIDKLTEISKALNRFKARCTVIDKYAYVKAGQAPETMLANTWNNIADDLLRIFHFTKEESDNIRFDREIAGDLFREKLEKITSNEELYEKTIKALVEKILYLDSRTEFADIEKWNKNQTHGYKQAVDGTFETAEKELGKLGMRHTVRRLVGFEDVDSRSLKDLKLSFMIDRAKGVRSSFYRILSALDFYRKISTMKGFDHVLNDRMPRETKEALVEMCKQLLIKGHSSDYAIKFYFPIHTGEHLRDFGGDEKAMEEFYSQIEVKDGKVVNKYFGHHAATELADNAYDKEFYNSAMQLMHDQRIHPDTEKALGANLTKKYLQYRKDIIDFIGGDSYFAKGLHRADGASGGGSSELRFLLLGATPDEIIKNVSSQKYNGNKWLKIFGFSAAALLGFTTISQFFMGKMKGGNEK